MTKQKSEPGSAQATIEQLIAERRDLVKWIDQLEAKPAAVDLSQGAIVAAGNLSQGESELHAARVVLKELDRALETAGGILEQERSAAIEIKVSGLRADQKRATADLIAAVKVAAAKWTELCVIGQKLADKGAADYDPVANAFSQLPVMLTWLKFVDSVSRPAPAVDLSDVGATLEKMADPILSLADSIRAKITPAG